MTGAAKNIRVFFFLGIHVNILVPCTRYDFKGAMYYFSNFFFIFKIEAWLLTTPKTYLTLEKIKNKFLFLF